MCMDNLLINRCRQRIAYKRLFWDTNKERWVTPIRSIPIESKILIAKETPMERFRSTWKLEHGKLIYDRERLMWSGHAGAIHCYKTEFDAEISRTSMECIFKVIGTDIVGHNAKEIAFRQIEFIDDPNDWEWDFDANYWNES